MGLCPGRFDADEFICDSWWMCRLQRQCTISHWRPVPCPVSRIPGRRFCVHSLRTRPPFVWFSSPRFGGKEFSWRLRNVQQRRANDNVPLCLRPVSLPSFFPTSGPCLGHMSGIDDIGIGYQWCICAAICGKNVKNGAGVSVKGDGHVLLEGLRLLCFRAKSIIDWMALMGNDLGFKKNAIAKVICITLDYKPL